MGGDAGGGLARPLRRGAECAIRLPLKPQHAVGENIRRFQRLTQALGHGAQILAHDHALLALAGQGQLGQQRRAGVSQIAAGGTGRAIGHQEQPLQPHHMVNAQRLGVAHIGG